MCYEYLFYKLCKHKNEFNFLKSILLGSVLLITSCAGVKFYSDEALTQETGLPFGSGKPFILVKRISKDQVDISFKHIEFNPKTLYAKYTPGLGTHEFSLNLSDGVLTSYGQKTDSKIPETINAVAGLLKEGAATAASAGAMSFLPQGAPDYKIIGGEFKDIGESLYKAIEGNKLSHALKSLNKVSECTPSAQVGQTRVIA